MENFYPVNEYQKVIYDNDVEELKSMLDDDTYIRRYNQTSKLVTPVKSYEYNLLGMALFRNSSREILNELINSLHLKIEDEDEEFDDRIEYLNRVYDDPTNNNLMIDYPLHIAINNGNLEIVRLLLDNGAKIQEKTLDIAAKKGNVEIVRLLLERGANHLKIPSYQMKSYSPEIQNIIPQTSRSIAELAARYNNPPEISGLLMSYLNESGKSPNFESYLNRQFEYRQKIEKNKRNELKKQMKSKTVKGGRKTKKPKKNTKQTRRK